MHDIVAHRDDLAIEPQDVEPYIDARTGFGHALIEADQPVEDEAVADPHHLEAGGALPKHDLDGASGVAAIADFFEVDRAKRRQPVALLAVMLAPRLAALQRVTFGPAGILRAMDCLDGQRAAQTIEQAG